MHHAEEAVLCGIVPSWLGTADEAVEHIISSAEIAKRFFVRVGVVSTLWFINDMLVDADIGSGAMQHGCREGCTDALVLLFASCVLRYEGHAVHKGSDLKKSRHNQSERARHAGRYRSRGICDRSIPWNM